MKPQSSESARKSERVSLDIRIQVITETDVSTFGRTHDISYKGMSIYFALELEVGAPIQVKFTLPNSRMPLELKAVIRNRVGFRYGIQFVKATTEQLEEIARVTGILALTQS